jgi:hypothetical protein
VLDALRRLGQRYLDLRIAEKAVDAAEVGDGGEAALLERRFQRRGRVLPGDVLELRLGTG